MRFPVKITSSCIWVAIPVDWVILHWYTCCADGRSGGRCTVKWLPSFLGWVVYHIFLPTVLRCAFRARELRYYITYFLFRLEIELFILASFKSEEVLEVVNFVWNLKDAWGLIVLRIIQKLLHQTIFHGIIDIQSAFNSVRFLAISRAKAVCLDILNFSRPEFLSLLLLSMTIIVSILFFFRRKNWKNTLLTERFLITESRRHKNNILSGRASDITRWRRLPCIYLSRYSLPASRK